jgi:Ran GTPase-activating protein (RanGAP) involved in mRNA processing and transport
MDNQTIRFLNLGTNAIKEKGLSNLVAFLNQQTCQVQELSLNGNKINSEGINIFAGIVAVNKSLTMLDIGKNEFSDFAFNNFASQMGKNQTLRLLDLSRNKDLSDEGSLVTLVQSIAFNRALQTIDLNGIRIRKPFLKSHFEPNLKSNITLKYVIGKLTPDIIDEELQTNITIENEIIPNF